jgi:hypothetical protein
LPQEGFGISQIAAQAARAGLEVGVAHRRSNVAAVIGADKTNESGAGGITEVCLPPP